MCCNNDKRGFFGGYEAFWMIVVFAIVLIWVMYYNDCGCGNGNGNGNCGCDNNCCC
ncbi:hypothetical protein [Acidaminobacterium chupaoyuni]